MAKFNIDTWLSDNSRKEIRPADLGELISPGDRVYIGSACSEPSLLTTMLVEEKWRWPDVNVLHFFTLSNQKFFSEEGDPTAFRHNSLSIIGSEEMRAAINSGRADFTPIMTHEIPAMIESQRIPIDVAMIQVSPPDRHGYCSLGINVDVNLSIVKHAKKVIAHVNPLMPRTTGNSFIRLDDIDHFVFEKKSLLEQPAPRIDPVHHEIASHVARLVENGATVNLGSGKTSYILPEHLSEKQDLALYSEMLPETIVPLVDGGVVTCKKNHYDHCMTSFVLGGRRFYDFIDNNPFIEFHPTEFISDIFNISRNNKLCSVYGALTVDLLGQATNHLGPTLHGGTGGEADFMRASSLSRGGKAIVALPSSSRDGHTRIVPFLPPGPVNLRAIDVHYVVTEHGIAYLHGKSIRERVLQMISISAPEFRQKLLERAKKLSYVYEDQLLPTTQDGVVAVCPEISWVFQPRDRSLPQVTFRPVRGTEERKLQDLYYSLSEEDRIHRFLSYRKSFLHKDTQAQMVCDYQNSMVLVGTIGDEEDYKIVAEGAFYRDVNTNLAEISTTIHRDYRGQGMAMHLFKRIIELAKERGISGLCGEIYADNLAMFHILNSMPYKVVFSEHAETFAFTMHFSDKKE